MLKEIIKEILKEELRSKPVEPINAPMLLAGQKCLIRTYSAGVHFGAIQSRNGQEVTLANARRVYSWKGANTLSEMAMVGVSDIANSKISEPVDSILLLNAIEIIPMTSKAYGVMTGECQWKS